MNGTFVQRHNNGSIMGSGNSVVVGQITNETKEKLEEIWKNTPTSSQLRINSSSLWKQSAFNRMKSGGGWKIVRVFVSSTFTDFYAEREVLVKYIFPKLREWCELRRICLVEVDLRWGVPAESTTETILRACLGEIERCIEENSIPFFINMLGHRYGWVPSRDQVPNDLFNEFEWKIGTSVTHMEIIRAALRAYNPHALFLFRDSNYLPHLPQEFSSQFLDNNWQSKVSMDLLKHHIYHLYNETNQVVNYSLSINGIDNTSGLSKLTFTGLDYFGQKVFEFLQNAICLTFSESCKLFEDQQLQEDSGDERGGNDDHQDHGKPTNNLTRKQAQLETCQNYFCDYRLCHDFFGRNQVIQTILSYCLGDALKSDEEEKEKGQQEQGEKQEELPLPPTGLGDQNIHSSSHENEDKPHNNLKIISSSAPFVLFTPLSGTGLSTLLAITSTILTNEDIHTTISPPLPHLPTPSSHTLYHSMQAYDDLLHPIGEGETLSHEEERYLSVTRLLFRIILKFGSYSLIEELFVSFSQGMSYDMAVLLFSKLFQTPHGFREEITASSPACLFIDTIDSKDRYLLTHFPSPLPPYLRVVISTHSESVIECCVEQYSLSNERNIYTMSPLDSSHIRDIITAKMMLYNKRLDSTQLSLLCERSNETKNNLHWVYMACEEVRMFGAFETVTTYIENLPTNLVDLFQVYLARIIQAGATYQAGYMDYSIRDSLLLLFASSSGLLEQELMDLLPRSRNRQIKSTKSITATGQQAGHQDSEGEQDEESEEGITSMPFSEWSNVFIFLKPLLHLTCPDESLYRTQYRPRYTFRSNEIKEAIMKYFSIHSSSSEQTKTTLLTPYWKDLIQYFNDPTRDSTRRAEELPSYFIQLLDYTSLYKFIRAGYHFVLPGNKIQRYLHFLRCPQLCRPMTANMNSNTPPYPERMCLICAMKCSFHPSRINKMSCALCGQCITSIYWTSNGENSVRLSPLESYLYCCRNHSSKAYLDQNIFKPDCYVCKLPIGAVKMSFCVVICHFCKLAGNRCGYLRH